MNLLPKIRVYSLKDTKTLLSLVLNLSLILLICYPLLYPNKTNAAVTEAFVRFDRLATGAAISGTACLKTSTVGTEASVVLVIPGTWTVSQTAANWTVTTTNLPTDPVGGGAATAWVTIGSPATSVSGNSVVFSSGDLATATFYCFNFSGASSTVGGAGNDQVGQLKTRTSVAALIDTVDYATSVVASGADQIVVTASVSASMTFSLSANSVALGTLASGTTTAGSAITQTVSTNARNGWTSWVKSGTDGGASVGTLRSAVASAEIDSPGTHDGTPETLTTSGGYILDVNTGSGTPTVAAEYDGATADAGGHLDFSPFRQTATTTAPASSNTVTLVVKARSAATTPAASDYTDTLTVVAAGSF